MQPLRRFDLDATIVFSDILVVPEALGCELRFVAGDGPTFGNPIRSAAAVASLERAGVTGRLAYVYEAVSALRKAAPDQALYGFAGSPWTLFCYAVQGEGSSDFAEAKRFIRAEPGAAQKLLNLMTDVVIAHLESQIAAGADVVQVFDTWGGLLSPSLYREWCAPGLARIAAAVHAPSVLFVRGGHLVNTVSTLGFTALSLHDTVELDAVAGITQGNLDPTTLFAGAQPIRSEVRRLSAQLGGRRNHIWNLGHGILPTTPPEAVAAFVGAVREYD